ncbi:HK97 family phage prohead protease [Caulobacter sp. FWC2]|uniref:HK97 family phage prohead protease n=1 Tax=Caulobacter sp. FWC2 TaxID=69664 RepID=UPI000C148E8C|nr:HK97 family phage prohead protease [Caulobacter sp. FWC2]PIB91002.1 HK97 family phage prohead protease [Caulobacter sp. FWC2]
MKTKDVKYANFKAEDIGDNYVAGYASTFGNVDAYGDVVEKGAFTRTLKARSGSIKFLKFHDPNQPIGKVTEIREDEKGLWVKAVFSSTVAGQEARTEVKEGVLDSFSIGFLPMKTKADKTDDGRVINRLQEVKLYEFSLVTFPANEQAVVTAVKSESDKPVLNELNQALLDQFGAFLLTKQLDEAAANDDAASEEIEDEDAAADDEAEKQIDTTVDEVSKAFSEALFSLKLEAALKTLRKRA